MNSHSSTIKRLIWYYVLQRKKKGKRETQEATKRTLPENMKPETPEK